MTGSRIFIWVDGGLVRSYHEELKELLLEFPKNKEKIDLMVVTHIDADHIGGILAFAMDEAVPKDFVHQFWFNSGRTLDRMFGGQPQRGRDIDMASLGMGTRSRSVRQGQNLESFLSQHGGWHDVPIQAGQEFALYGAKILLLSPNETCLRQLHKKWETETQTSSRAVAPKTPDKSLEELAKIPEDEDDAIPNGSSIAFVFELHEQRILLLGDSHPKVIIQALSNLGYTSRKPLHLTAAKLSHHASRRSISNELLSLIRCNHYFVCTDGSRHGLPDKEAFAKILLHPKRKKGETIRFTFNYGNAFLRGLFSEEEKQKHNFVCVYPQEGQKGMWVEV